MNYQNLIRGKDILPTDVDQHIWLADQSKSSESIQEDLWLDGQSEMSVPEGILCKNRCF